MGNVHEIGGGKWLSHGWLCRNTEIKGKYRYVFLFVLKTAF